MELSRREYLTKFILLFINTCFSIAGLAMLALGVVGHIQLQHILGQDGSYSILPIITIAVGGVVFLVAVLGCVGAVRDNNRLLTVYIVFLIMLIATEAGFAVYIFNKLGTAKPAISKALSYLATKERAIFETLKEHFACCGILNICENNKPACGPIVFDFFQRFGLAMALASSVVVVFEVFAILLAGFAMRNDKNKKRVY